MNIVFFMYRSILFLILRFCFSHPVHIPFFRNEIIIHSFLFCFVFLLYLINYVFCSYTLFKHFFHTKFPQLKLFRSLSVSVYLETTINKIQFMQQKTNHIRTAFFFVRRTSEIIVRFYRQMPGRIREKKIEKKKQVLTE